MRNLKTYLSVAPVLSTLWFGSLAGLLIVGLKTEPTSIGFVFSQPKPNRLYVKPNQIEPPINLCKPNRNQTVNILIKLT